MANFLRLLGRRLAALPLMILGVTLLVFVVLQFAPGDRAVAALGEGATPAALAQYRAANGFNDPLFIQYFRYLGRLITGDFGSTLPPAKPITEVIASAFPVTLQLTFLGVLIAVVISLVFGVLAALYRDTWVDQAIRVFSVAGIATPSFWLGILLIQWFALGSNSWFPSGGLADPSEGFPGWLSSMALPGATPWSPR